MCFVHETHCFLHGTKCFPHKSQCFPDKTQCIPYEALCFLRDTYDLYLRHSVVFMSQCFPCETGFSTWNSFPHEISFSTRDIVFHVKRVLSIRHIVSHMRHSAYCMWVKYQIWRTNNVNPLCHVQFQPFIFSCNPPTSISRLLLHNKYSLWLG